MDNFFGNKKQKAVWVIYIVLAIIIFMGLTSSYPCSTSGRCGHLVPVMFSLTLIFAVISLIFKSSKKHS